MAARLECHGSYRKPTKSGRATPRRSRSGASLRGLFDDGFDPRPNLEAERIDQAGATLRLRTITGDDPGRLRTSAELRVDAQTGDRTFARTFVRGSFDAPLGRGVAVSVTAAHGSAIGGEVPAQALWQIGGAATVRGQDPAAARGRDVTLARAELSFGRPALRLTAFGDYGYAGDSGPFARDRTLRGAGVGASLLGNLLRIDLARGSGWRMYFRVGAQ